jgi:hypothetical protein
VIRIAVIAGGLISAIGGVIYAVVIGIKADDFATTGNQTYEQANHLTSGTIFPLLQTLDIAGLFAFEIGVVLISLNAMRVGLLTRFLGYFGIGVGVTGMLLIGSPPAAVLPIVWLCALGYLFAGRWPGGDPPSWRTGRIEKWPTNLELREQRAKAAGGGGRSKPTREPEPVAASTPARTRSSTPKRKRKRRH